MQGLVFLRLVKIYGSCVARDHVPYIWGRVRGVLIPKTDSIFMYVKAFDPLNIAVSSTL